MKNILDIPCGKKKCCKWVVFQYKNCFKMIFYGSCLISILTSLRLLSLPWPSTTTIFTKTVQCLFIIGTMGYSTDSKGVQLCYTQRCTNEQMTKYKDVSVSSSSGLVVLESGRKRTRDSLPFCRDESSPPGWTSRDSRAL